MIPCSGPDIICAFSRTPASSPHHSFHLTRYKSYIFPLQISFWCCCSCTSFPSVIFRWADNGASCEPVIYWGGTSLKIRICLKRVCRWGRQAFLTKFSLTKRLLTLGLISWWSSFCFLFMAVPSLRVALSGLPRFEPKLWARHLEGFVRSIRCKAGVLLSSWQVWRCPATVNCQQHLWEAACFQCLWISCPYLSVWLINRCCRVFKLISCTPHCVELVHNLDWSFLSWLNVDEVGPSWRKWLDAPEFPDYQNTQSLCF